MIEHGDEPTLLTMHNKWMHEGQPFKQDAWDRVCEVIDDDMTNPEKRKDGSKRIRPSNLGKCLRLQQYSYLGETSNFRGNEYTMAGTWSHYRWQYAGLAAGWLKDIEVKVRTEYGVEGSMDGLTFQDNVWELKTTNFYTMKKVRENKIPPENLAQTIGYMDAIGAKQAHLFYEERGSLKVTEVIVPFTQKASDSLRADSEKVSGGNELTVLDVCKKMTGKQYEYCDYKHICQPWLHG